MKFVVNPGEAKIIPYFTAPGGIMSIRVVADGLVDVYVFDQPASQQFAHGEPDVKAIAQSLGRQDHLLNINFDVGRWFLALENSWSSDRAVSGDVDVAVPTAALVPTGMMGPIGPVGSGSRGGF